MMSHMDIEQVEYGQIRDGKYWFYRMIISRDKPLSIISQWNGVDFEGTRMNHRPFTNIFELGDTYSEMIANLHNAGYSRGEWLEEVPVEDFNRDVDDMRRAEEAARA